MSARTETLALMQQLATRGIAADFDQANTLRRAQIALHRWAELECGDGNEHASWSIERDEKTQKPFMCWYPHTGNSSRRPIADKENGALKRVARICVDIGANYYHQTDPRGCALYVAKEKLTDQNYTRGVAVCS